MLWVLKRTVSMRKMLSKMRFKLESRYIFRLKLIRMKKNSPCFTSQLEVYLSKLIAMRFEHLNPFTAVINTRNTPGENTAISMLLWCYI